MARKATSQAFGLSGARLQRVEHLAGGVERNESDGDAETLAKLAGEIGGNAFGVLIAGTALRQHAVAVIDRGTQRAGGSEILQNIGRHNPAPVVRNAGLVERI